MKKNRLNFIFSLQTKPLQYYYLKYRQKNKIKTDYLGRDKTAAREIEKKIEERKHLQDILKRLKLEYRQICKIVKEF